ncbi:tetratricopeptide repeat protein [Cupriavidus necator]|uniref:tetratricopeptide repeat protein n=1 Tax=Cupriavidus necator TaxID=106590 RepID=UPI00339D5277
MRRRTIHLAFATAALIFGALAADQALQLRKATQIHQAVAAANAGADASTVAGNIPEARLAQANALARAGRHDAALETYNSLIQRGGTDAVGQAALFNLGNMLLRQGRETAANDAFQGQALVELAKQRYRDLLRANPDDWDARYNLERALRLAPEVQDVFGAETDDMPKERLRIKVPGLPPGDLP